MITQAWVAFKICFIMYVAGYAFAWLARPAEAKWVKSRALPLMAGLFATGMLTPNIWIMYVVIAAGIPLLARSRSEAAALYIVTVLSLPRIEREIGFAGVYIFAFDKWLMGALGMAIAWVKLPAVGPRPSRWFDVPFLLVMVLEAVMARGNNLTSVLRIELLVILCYMMPYYLITRSMRRPEDVRIFLLGLCFAGFILAVIGVYESRTTFLVFDAIGERLGSHEVGGGYVHQRSGMLRAHTSLGDATAFGLFLAMTIMATLPLRDVFRSNRYWLAAVAVLGLGIYVTNSRGCVLALAVGLVCYDVYRKRYQSLSVKLGLMGLVYAVALLAAQFSDNMAQRMGVSGDSAGNTDYRHHLFDRGVEEIKKHPLTGVSTAQTFEDLADLRTGEGLVDFVNGYIFYGMVTGVEGVVALFLCFALTAYKAMQNRRRLSIDRNLVEIGGMVFGIALMVMLSCFTSGFGGRSYIIFYLLIGIGSALTAMRLAPSRPTPETAPAPSPTPATRPLGGRRPFA